MSPSQLSHSMWGTTWNSGELIRRHIQHIRGKIEEDPQNPQLIVTQKSHGYAYVKPTSESIQYLLDPVLANNNVATA